MPSHKKRLAPVRCAIALALSLTFTPLALHAAGLGRLSVQSALGQPLKAEVELTAVAREEAPTLAVRLASESAFRQAGLDFNPALAQLRFSLERRGETNYVVSISSLNPVNEPFLDVLLELTWATGRVLREYTVLLDPPALRAAAEPIPPVTAQGSAPSRVPAAPPATSAAAPASAPSAPATAPERPAPAARESAAAPPPAAAGDSYLVKPGDTLGRIAAANKAPSVSLDQMLVAMFRANPNAFVGDNMNRLIAGRALTIPSTADAEAIGTTDARREVVAQSRDFAQYRSRLAQAATGGSATAVAAAPAAAAGQGRIIAKVEERSSPVKSGDQLKIAKAEPAPAAGGQGAGQTAAQAAAAAAAKAKDEEVARQRAQKEAEERAAELKKTNEALKKALELQSKAGAQAQQQAESKPAPAPAPAAGQAPQAAAPVAPPATASPEPAKAAEPAKVDAPAAAAPAPAPVAKAEPAKKALPPPPPPPAPEPSFVEQLMSPYVLGGAAGVLLLLLLGFNLYRKRKLETTEEFKATGEGMHANSLFGSTGGQSVDTAATSTFNSSFIPAASQLDSNEVDPVAEADVYIAYGREEQAEDILKEALRLQPDRHAVRVKLLEIYSRSGDKASFNAVAEELRTRTGGVGEEWDRAVKLGRALDPSNSMFLAASMEASARGSTTELRLNPNTAGAKSATLGGGAPMATSSTQAERRAPTLDFGLGGVSTGNALDTRSQPADTRMSASDTRMAPETAMQVDSRMSPDTTQAVDARTAATPQAAPSKFEATLSEVTMPPRASAIDTGAPTPPAIDFSLLDFDLGAPKSTSATAPAAPPIGFDLGLDLPASASASAPAIETPSRSPAPSVTVGVIPDVDLDIPARPPAPAPAASFSAFAAPAPAANAMQLEESLSRPTLIGDVGALPDEQAPWLTSNTDQATVPLIDFDLSGSDVELGGRRTETQAGSPLAAQMATKLDLARGYIDLGVKDGARELIEEVMRDGTREQRQSAVELMKQVEE